MVLLNTFGKPPSSAEYLATEFTPNDQETILATIVYINIKPTPITTIRIASGAKPNFVNKIKKLSVIPLASACSSVIAILIPVAGKI